MSALRVIGLRTILTVVINWICRGEMTGRHFKMLKIAKGTWITDPRFTQLLVSSL